MIKNRMPEKLFLSYAPEDYYWQQKVERCLSVLQHQSLITIWHNRLLPPGKVTQETIETHLNQASIILLLISSHFLHSDQCYKVEMPLALARQQAGTARVIPIIVRDADWKHAPIEHLHPLPTDGKPIASWPNKDKALTNVAEGIRRVIEGKPLHTNISPIVPQTTLKLPYSHNHYFIGRDEALSQLHKELDTSPQAISGLGGVGKTRLAVEYACRYYQSYETVLWVQASTIEALVSGYAELARKLKLPLKHVLASMQVSDYADPTRKLKPPLKHVLNESVIREAVRSWLQSHDRWLLIFDNADEPGLIRDFLPAQPTGHILLTTRTRDLKGLALRFELTVLDEESSALFLLRRIHLLSLNAPLEQANDDAQKLARKLAHELQGLPLALEQAGAYMDNAKTNLADYLSLYQTHRSKLLSNREDMPVDYSETVATTWNISFERMVQHNAAAADLFHFCAFLASDAIPEEMITKGAKHLGKRLQRATGDAFAFGKLLRNALSYSLLERDNQRKMLLIHRLVQIVLHDGLDEGKRLDWQERVIKVLAMSEVFPWPKFSAWEQCERVMPHALECLRWQDNKTFASRDMEAVCRKTARYLMEHAQYKEAEPILLRAFSISEQLQQIAQVSAPDPSLWYELASLHHVQGRYKDAEAFYKKALSFYEQILAHPSFHQDKRIHQHLHSEISGILNNLAVLYYNQERYAEAEPLYKQSLDISKQLYGLQHPDTAQSINNLAELYRIQKRFADAEPMFQQALAIRKQVLKSNHPAIALTLNALGALYMDQKKYEQAALLYEQALGISKQAHGSEHTDVATIQNNLAMLYKSMDKKEEAEVLYLRALKILEQQLEPEHPNILRARNNLTELRKSMEKQEKAETQDS